MTSTLIDMASAPWMTEGACRDEDPELFFPISASEAGTDQIDRARAICDGCHVQAECLRYALTNRIKHGIWGGRTEQQRQSLIRARRRLKVRTRP
ncbi:WhiB family transcriptional regulator [Actinoallomurus acaciae]|uniref:Transcriptional regulator WhiB n=1 Tax=Actinoallomurus acaciae TaxID=502577 RepID=A0ABV5YRB8_9ACTN